MSNSSSIFSDKFKETPYWHDDVPVPDLSSGSLPKSVDVCIIGAGFTGLSTALHLLQAGKSVVVFDAMTLGEGASGKNGGMVGPGFHKLGIAGLASKYGKAKAYAIMQEGLTAMDHLTAFITREKIDCDLQMKGRFRGVTNAKDLEDLVKGCDQLMALKGFKYHVVYPEDTQREIGTSLYHGGVVYERDGGLNPFKLLVGMARNVMALGGEIFEKTRVGDLVKTATGFDVDTSGGPLQAGQVVVASNGYTKMFSKKRLFSFSRRLLPITSAMVATEKLPKDMMDRFFPKRRMHGGNHRIIQYYRPSPDGKRILFGARGVDSQDRAQVNALDIHRHLGKLFPELDRVKLDFSWSGKVAYTFDHAPHIGQHEGLYFAIGYCGSGVAKSIYFGRQLARRMVGSGDHHTTSDALNFGTKPFYTGTPWFLPPILMWHSFMDKIENK